MQVQLRPNFHIVPNQVNRSYVIIHEPLNLTAQWHYHNEIQLLYLIEGKINCIISHRFRELQQGDLILLGTNLPHLLRENPEFAKERPGAAPLGFILQFKENFLGQEFIDSPDMIEVKKLFERSKLGIKFKKEFAGKIAEQMLYFDSIPENRKLLALLNLLVTMAEAAEHETEFLTSMQADYHNMKDEERMIRIKEFLQANFTEKIAIGDMAALVNMSEASFCRFFMSRTLKNFTQYINEMRISHACQLLTKKEVTVTDACFECGFNSLSYFYRQFNKIMGMSPKHYQQKKHHLLEFKDDGHPIILPS